MIKSKDTIQRGDHGANLLVERLTVIFKIHIAEGWEVSSLTLLSTSPACLLYFYDILGRLY